MSNTKEVIPAAPQKRVLIQSNSAAALQSIAQARKQVPVLQDIINRYHRFKWDRKISDMETLSELIKNPTAFINEERLKDIPEFVDGIKVNRQAFLTHVVVAPAGLTGLIDLITSTSIDLRLFAFDEKGNIAFNEEAATAMADRFNVYAEGSQAEVYEGIEQLLKATNHLHSLGIRFDQRALIRFRDPNYPGDQGEYQHRDPLFCQTMHK